MKTTYKTHLMRAMAYAPLGKMWSVCGQDSKPFYLDSDGIYYTHRGHFDATFRKKGPKGSTKINQVNCSKCLNLELSKCPYQDAHKTDPFCEGCGAGFEVLEIVRNTKFVRKTRLVKTTDKYAIGSDPDVKI